MKSIRPPFQDDMVSVLTYKATKKKEKGKKNTESFTLMRMYGRGSQVGWGMCLDYLFSISELTLHIESKAQNTLISRLTEH